MKFEAIFKPKLIYVFRINDEQHKDCLKIGETTYNGDNLLELRPNCRELNQAAKGRINQYTQTAGIAYDLLYTELTLYSKDGSIKWFNDKEVHNILLNSGIKRKVFDKVNKANEWFIADLETVKNAIAAAKEGRNSLYSSEITEGKNPIIFRPEQQEAIEKTVRQFRKKSGKQMLWNAKMRFGKTLSALEVVKQLQFKRTLILTHRPVVDDGWFDDFQKIFDAGDGYVYGSKKLDSDEKSAHKNLERRAKEKEEYRYIYFASMQDLRGSEQVGGLFDKNSEVFATPWNLIIVDEAHEGIKTDLGEAVMEELIKDETKVLRLSGTPFNLINDFKEEEIYTWDYVMEQRAKKNWDKIHQGDPNPYAGLPTMNIYTYDMSALMKEYADEDIAFNFREFFRVDSNGLFIHEKDVKAFLNLMTVESESHYPFANKVYRDIFRHTLWMVPGVKEAKALCELLREHPVFQFFTIVNVAGEGDEEQNRKDALNAVRSAITDNPELTRTITVSCGRLTTGVSVKEWTAVMMLSGTYNTAASSYMQTIFRVQTPAVINGKMKDECFVFDFAPDRTLKVIAETAKISAKAGKTTDDDRKIMGEFLNYCSVIAAEKSAMKKYDVDGMLQQLKKVYVERVVQNGFEDNSLYNDELLQLNDVDLGEFNELKKIIGKTPAMPKTNEIDINKTGLTNEQYEELEKLERKNRKKKKEGLTEEEQKRLEELRNKKENKKNAISILRGISIRMPMMIYGAELTDESQEITLDNFTDLIDPNSWEEFMPKGITKQHFRKFKRYYDPDIFCAAGKRIRALARAADRLTVEERIERIADIFSTFRNPDKETVLTPWRVVNMHLAECLGGYEFFDESHTKAVAEPRYADLGEVTDEVFRSDAKILEINSKSGLYPLYMAYSIYRKCLQELTYSVETVEQQQKVWDKVLAENIFVVCKTKMAKSITRRTLLGFREGKVNARYFEDIIKQIENKPKKFIEQIQRKKTYGKSYEDEIMKFDAVVGNPPYQEEGLNTRKSPIYHYFYDLSFALSDKATLITPARFLFKAGQTSKDWMDKILNDPHFKVVRYFQKSAEVFPSVDIKGGVVIAYRDAKRNFGKIKFFSEYQELRSILAKVQAHNQFKEGEFAELVSSQGLYKFANSIFDEFPRILKIQGKGTGAKITSKSFENLTEVFLHEKPNNEYTYIQILGRIKNDRVYRWIKKDYVQTNEYLEYYNIFVPEANGTGAIGEVLSTPIIGTPMIGHTDTFLSIGQFKTKLEAENCLKYVRSKFARTMLGTLKATQHNPRDTWSNIPLQNFTSSSDIDWDKPVSDIDQQLYHKYALSEDEIKFIEKMIRPM